MPEIILTNVTKRWGKFYAVDDLNLTIADNSFITLLGPSGCGKTTTLRMIAGLETPTSGRITIGDQVVFDSEKGINIPANKRKVGFLFQNYALWPNMTVYENISFGLSNVKEEMPKINFEARNATKLLEILAKPDEICRVLDACRDKNGTVEEEKATIKFIDAFIISRYTAKILYDYKVTPEKDLTSIISALERKRSEEIKSSTSDGCQLNKNFELEKNGVVVTETRKLTKEEINLVVQRVSRVVKIGMFMDRYPAELSGGQQQRVAIARTLAPEPSVLFMDEPLSNLDAKLRLEMRYELQRLHVESGSTFVYVTHDQMEAMTLATQICLLENGVLQQYEEPLVVYNRPKNLFVADFVGNPSINFVEVTAQQQPDGRISMSLLNDCKAVFTPTDPVNLEQWLQDRDKRCVAKALEDNNKMAKKSFVEKGNKDEVFPYHIGKSGNDELYSKEQCDITNEDFIIAIRPEYIDIGTEGNVDGEVYGAMPTGMESTVKICLGDFLLTCVVFGSTIFAIGEKVKIKFSGSNILLFDRKSQQYISAGTLTIS